MANKTKERKLKSNPKAIATQLGWVDPERGELLVSIRGLVGAKKWDRKANTFNGKPYKNAEEKPEEPKPEKVEVKKEEVKSEQPAVIEAPKAEKPKAEKKPATKKATTKKAKTDEAK